MDAQFVRNLSLDDLHRARAQAIADVREGILITAAVYERAAADARQAADKVVDVVDRVSEWLYSHQNIVMMEMRPDLIWRAVRDFEMLTYELNCRAATCGGRTDETNY